MADGSEHKKGSAVAPNAAESSSRLRVLIANEREDRLDVITAIVEGLGHEVVARGLEVESVAQTSRLELPDVALVGLGTDPAHALEQISQIVKEAACPVIALLDFDDPAYVNEAAKRGAFAYLVTNRPPAELQSALDITLRRFAEYQNLEGAFGRRAVIERAKGILMERHRIEEQEAFELLRQYSRDRGRKLIEIAQAVNNSHRLLPDNQPSERSSEY